MKMNLEIEEFLLAIAFQRIDLRRLRKLFESEEGIFLLSRSVQAVACLLLVQ